MISMMFMAKNFGRMKSVNIFSRLLVEINELDSSSVLLPCFGGMLNYRLRNDSHFTKEKTDLYGKVCLK